MEDVNDDNTITKEEGTSSKTNHEDALERDPIFCKYQTILIDMTRASKSDTAAQLIGIKNLTSLFNSKTANDTTSFPIEVIMRKLVQECHLTKAVHRSILNNSFHPRICSLGSRILANIVSMHPIDHLIFQDNCLDTAVTILQTHDTDISAVRSALCLLSTLLSSKYTTGSNEPATLRFQRTQSVGLLLNKIIKNNLDDAVTVEWAIAVCCYVGHYGGRNLPVTICSALSTHPTDVGIVRSSLAALCSLGEIKMNQEILILRCGIFKILRSILDLRPSATKDITIKVCILMTHLLTCKQGREALIRMKNQNLNSEEGGEEGHRQNIEDQEDQEDYEYSNEMYGGVTNGERLIISISECLPNYSEIELSYFSISLRSVLNALTMIALSSKQARYILMVRCRTIKILEGFLNLQLPTIRLRFDIEMALAAIKGEIETKTRESLLNSMRNGGNRSIRHESSTLNNSGHRGQRMKPIRNNEGVIGMKLGSA
jgi:hypothetical protein